MSDPKTVPLHVIRDGEIYEFAVPVGMNLRRWLLANDLTPYVWIARQVNCGGRGLCATCGVRVLANEPPPTHWHDKLAKQFGYPRLSCQLTVDAPLTVRIMTEKRLWGARQRTRIE